MKTLKSNKPFLVVAITALILAGLVGYIAIQLEQIYRQNYPYRSVDPVYYSYYNARLYVRLSYENRFSLAAQEWLENERHPLRTVPLLLVAPSLLAQPQGHMATSLPMYAILLWVMGWTVYRRTQHLFYALAIITLLGATKYLYNGDSGLAAYWLDPPMSFLFGATALCLVNSRGRDLRWLAAFAVLAALTALSRYVAAGYLFFVCAPLLAYYLARRWWQERNIWQTVILPAGIVAAIIMLLAGDFLLTHFSGVMGFYSSYGYALGHGIQESLARVIRTFSTTVSADWLWVLLAMAVFNLFLIWRNKTRDWENLIVSVWLSIAPFLLFGVILRVVGAKHLALMAVPQLLLLCSAPMFWQASSERRARWAMSVAACLILCAAVMLTGKSIYQNYNVATHPSLQDRRDKIFEDALVQLLQAEGHPIVWNFYFAEYAWKPSMVSFFQSGVLPLPAGQVFFNEHLTAWQADYPGLNPDQVFERIYTATTQWVDIAAVLAEPQQAMQAEWLVNDYSRIVAAQMSARLAQDPNWEKIVELESGLYGRVLVYRNLTSNGSAYKQAFYGGLHP